MSILEKLERGISWVFNRNEYLDLVKREEIKNYNERVLKKLKRRA
jgi:hypothetical protein